MRKKIKQLMKRSLAGIAALAMMVSCLPSMGLPAQAKEAQPVSVSNFTSRISDEIVLENTGGDNLVLLQSLSAEDEFVFGADVTFTNLDEQQSAALIFGIKDNALDDSRAIKANIHARIDWNVPARVWGYGTDELRCPGESGQANTFFADNGINVTQKFRMEVSVQKNAENRYVLTYSLTNTDGVKVTAAQGILNDSYTGGRFGLMTYSSRAVFSNITVDGQKYGALESAEGVHTIHGVNGDAHTVSDVYMEREEGFTYETDVDLAADTCSAALTFGIQNKDNPGEAWIGANFNFNDNNGAGGARVFKVGNGGGDIGSASLEGKLDRAKTIHLKLHVSSTGLVTYELYNTDNAENKVTVTGTVADYQGGYLGLLTFDSSAVFTNTTYTLDVVLPDASDYKTNLGELTYAGGSGNWAFTENGLYSDATGKGDCFAFSQVQGTNFVYSTDIDFDGTEGAAALVFRSNQDLDNKECYAVNIDVGSHKCKFWRWQENEALQLIDEKEVPAAADEKYTLKVVAYDSWILYYVNDQLVASTGDYVLQPGNKGQDTVIKEGCFGILNWNSKVTFQNTYYKELTGDFNPILTDITVTSSVGTVEEKTQFTPTEPITLQYVKNDASKVNIQVTRASSDAVVEIMDANGTVYAGGKNIPVSEGSNYITVTSTVTAEDGTEATATYRVNVHRFKEDEVYYNEAYRSQYHYSVKEGWANDPNGLVYYNGTYHMFYQFYDDIVWGPMHWAHATSTDLIHWEEQPIALYPDANGAMYSGCMVVDEDNTSGFFDGIQGGGLVALITADGNGERIKLAYSTDEGKTWTKVDEIAADWTDDPLNDAAFRDPKVFRWEGKWFMVVAGGPLRIYSSDNLREWTCEATYADLHTECPDLYPIEAPDGQIKWVLSRGGRFYKIGDFKTVNGKWRFVPDDDYVNSDGVMNFGRDFYAAMTYYVQDFGTAANPNLPELIELNWMNTWDDYCNQVAEAVGQDFNGTFNLNLKLGLKKDGSKYVLTQTPISGYETLRQTSEKQEWKQVTVETNNTLLKDFVGDTYEIIAKFYPGEGTRKVGFKVRTGEDEETLVVYDLETQNLSIDRSNSGVIISGKFAETTSQTVAPNADGTVDLHIYVDKACVEAFAQDYTAVGSVQIFPSPVSVGAAVLVEGNPAKADITIYPLSSIWTDKAEITEPQYIGTTAAAEQKMYVGDTLKLNAYVLPITVSQEMTWSVQEGKDVAKVDASGTVTALKKGTAVIVAASKAAPELTTEFAIEVTENNFNTNLSGFVNVNGNWHIDDETLSVSNGGQNDYYMSAEAVEGDFTLETNISYTAGLINLFLASEDLNPHLGAGAYTIQFGYDTNVRLFPFGYNDFATGTLVSRINDGEYHHVKVVKEGQTVTVYVDEAKCLEHTFDAVETFFAKGYVGIGLWDGALDVQEFFVSPLEEEPDPTEPTEPEPTEPEPTEPEPTEPEPTEPADPDADGDGIPDSFGAYQENGIYILDNCYGYVFEIDDVNGTIDGEDITLITTQTAYESCNPSWAISVQLRPTDDGSYEVVKVVECPGSVSAAGITLQTNDVVLVVHSAASCPGDYENWLSKIAAVALKEGDIIEIASDNTTAAVIGPAEEEPTPIQITLQPTDVAVRPGEAAVVTLEATGDGLTYTWYFKNSGSSSFKKTTAFTGPTYSVTMNESRSGRQVYCLVMDQYGNRVQSDIVMLSMYTTPLEIVTQPESVTVAEGETASATVEAAGDGLTYTWYYRNSGATQFSATTTFTGPVYYITMNDARDGRQIYCVIGDMYGNEVTTDIVTLSMVKNVATIVKQPVDVEVEAGELAEVTLEATGDDLTYSWYYKNAGAASFKKTTAFNGPSYSVVMNESRSGRQVYCLVMDRYGNRAQSDVVTLTMHTTPLELLAQPEDVTVAEGETAVVTLEAIGDGLTYEWYYKSATGSKFTKTTTFTGPSYSIMMNASRSGRQVYCVITDAYGNSLTTRTVTLSMEQVEEAPLVLVAQPEGFTIAKGDVGEVYVEATGDGLTYEWYYKSATGSKFTKTDTFTGPAYTLTMSAARAGRHVYCVVTDKYGESIQTDIVTLNMESELELLDQPEDVTAAIGETAVVTADVVGEDLTYSWYYRDAGTTAFKKTTSFTGDTYSLKMTAARAGRQVYCVVSDAEGNVVVTDIVTLSVPG